MVRVRVPVLEVVRLGNRIHIDQLTMNVIVGMFVMLAIVSSGLFYLATDPPVSPIDNPIDVDEPAFNASDHSPSTTEPINVSFEPKPVGFNFTLPEARIPKGEFSFPAWMADPGFFDDSNGDGLPDMPSEPHNFTLWESFQVWNGTKIDNRVTVLTIQGNVNLDVFGGHFLPNVAEDWSYIETLFEPAPPVISAMLLIFPIVFVLVVIRAIEVQR